MECVIGRTEIVLIATCTVKKSGITAVKDAYNGAMSELAMLARPQISYESTRKALRNLEECGFVKGFKTTDEGKKFIQQLRAQHGENMITWPTIFKVKLQGV